MSGNSSGKIGVQGSIVLKQKEFLVLSDFIMKNFGIKMPASKKSLLQGRLQKRLKALNFSDFKEYTDYLFSLEGRQNEVAHLISEVSTNKTDFFREKIHFDFLSSQGLDEYLKKKKDKKYLSVWSAGCSTGEEPYSLAIMLNEYKLRNPEMDYSILATDISPKVLKHAQQGIYEVSKVETVSDSMLKRYFQRGKNEYSNKVRVKKNLSSKIIFQSFNLKSSAYHAMGKHDLIFCRNVLIYFERALQFQILNQLCYQLNPGGYLFLGHSESVIGFKLPIQQIKPTIFVKVK